MRYCNNCLCPDTKPDLAFDANGKCKSLYLSDLEIKLIGLKRV